MTIYLDPSEARTGTRLPAEIIAAGIELPGLEAKTGADLLITRDRLPMTDVSHTLPPPLEDAFLAACQSGILVQRKSGTDLLNSLGKLNTILILMQIYGGECWLVSTGILECRAGKVVLDKHVTEVKWATLTARLLFWQRRGGMTINLPDDDHLTTFVVGAEKFLVHPQEKVVAMTRQPEQRLVPAGWYERLTVVPGIGLKVAKAVADWLPEGYQTLANALQYLSHPDDYARADHPVGVGPGTMEAVRDWLMLTDSERMMVVDKEQE